MQVTCVHNTVSTLDEESSERKLLEEILTTTGVPPLATIQGLCSNVAANGSLHASPNTTPQPTPPGTPSSIRKLAKLAQQGECCTGMAIVHYQSHFAQTFSLELTI